MHGKPLFLWLAFLSCLSVSTAQETFTLSGGVLDGETGETLIGATVQAPDLGQGAVTNAYGFFSLTLPARDSVLLQISYVGFQTQSRWLYLTGDLRLNFELRTGVDLEEVVVKASSFAEQLNSTEMSVEAVTTREARLLPVLLGESDILKAIQLKPGIPSGSEGATGLPDRPR